MTIQNKLLNKISDKASMGIIAWYTTIAILILAGCFVHFYHPIQMPIDYDIELLPLDFNEWKAQTHIGSDGRLVILPDPDKEIRRSYKSESGVNHQLVIGHYAYQKQGKEFIHYTLDRIYHGAKKFTIQVTVDRQIDVQRVVIKEKGKKYLVTYWYDIGGHKTASNVIAKLITAVRGILLFKTEGSILLIITDLQHTGKDTQQNAIQDAFMVELYPYLSKYLKDE